MSTVFWKLFEILLGEIDGGLREKHGDKLLADVEDELAFVVGDGGTRRRGYILGCLQAVLALLAALEGR